MSACVLTGRQAGRSAFSQRVGQAARRVTSEECSGAGGVSSALRRTSSASHRRYLFTAERLCNATSKPRHAPNTVAGQAGSRLQEPDFAPLMSLQA